MTDTELIQLISDRKEGKALVKLYKYQGKVEGLIKSRGGSKEDAQDIFQDALMILCRNIWKGDFKLTSSLNTYLYSVSYNIWRNQSKKKSTDFEDVKGIVQVNEMDIEAHYEREKKFEKVESILRKIGDPCLKLLKMFYHQKMRMKDIAKELEYKTEDSAKVQKYKCLERAKKLV